MDFIKLFFSIFKLEKKKIELLDLAKSKKPNLNSWFKKQLFGFLLKFGRLKIERRNLYTILHLIRQMNMFVVSGHLYRPLPLSQPCGLKVKIKDGFGTRPPTFLGAGLSILVFP